MPAALQVRVEEQHAAIAADRRRGCGAGYDYRPEPARETTIGGRPAAIYAFSGVVDGVEIERQRAYYTVRAGQIWVVNAPASDWNGCMATEFNEFRPEHLTTFEPYLERIVAGMEPPEAGRATTDGIVVGVDGGLDGGLLCLLVEEGKVRIQQPAPGSCSMSTPRSSTGSRTSTPRRWAGYGLPSRRRGDVRRRQPLIRQKGSRSGGRSTAAGVAALAAACCRARATAARGAGLPCSPGRIQGSASWV